jgi:membrane protein DedA with SNARE-associated domain
MPQVRFQVLTFLGSWPWCFALAYVGLELGEHWSSDPRLRTIFHRFDALILAAIAAALMWHFWRVWREGPTKPE